MWQDILITDLTQMGGERVCIAGLNYDLQAVRPHPSMGDITPRHLVHPKFVVRPRAVVQVFLKPKDDNVLPHIEDHRWNLDAGIKFLRFADDTKWKRVLTQTTGSSVIDIFETPFDRNKNILPDQAKRSLGTLKPVSISRLEYQVLERHHKQAFYMDFVDASDTHYDHIPITDLALRRMIVSEIRGGKSAKRVCHELLQQWNKMDVWLRLGLGRPFQGRCWLQVNGVYTFPDYLNGRCFNDFELTGADTA